MDMVDPEGRDNILGEQEGEWEHNFLVGRSSQCGCSGECLECPIMETKEVHSEDSWQVWACRVRKWRQGDVGGPASILTADKKSGRGRQGKTDSPCPC